jgi:hypothetical protein
MTQDQEFEAALQIFESQVGEATQFWFAAAAMNEVARRNIDTLKALNVTPSFWVTARVAMEYQSILTVGKIFGPRKTNPSNIDSLFQVLREKRNAVFSKDALAARKRGLSDNAGRVARRLYEGCLRSDCNGSESPARVGETTPEDLRKLVRRRSQSTCCPFGNF